MILQVLVTSYKWSYGAPLSRVKFHPSETHVFLAIYKGYSYNSIIRIGLGLTLGPTRSSDFRNWKT